MKKLAAIEYFLEFPKNRSKLFQLLKNLSQFVFWELFSVERPVDKKVASSLMEMGSKSGYAYKWIWKTTGWLLLY